MDRKDKVYKRISESEKPISGATLAREFNVSRQVIVQDIALLRAQNKEIVSTHTGYIVKNSNVSRCIHVNHEKKDTVNELNAIVDCGGIIEDVFVKHEIYGTLKAPLNLKNRYEIEQFLKSMEKGDSKLLTDLTSGDH